VFPTIVELFGEPVSSYFTLLLVGFALATWLAARRTQAMGFDREIMIDLGLYSLIWGVIGGRILHVFADGHLSNYVYSCIDPSKVVWRITAAQCVEANGIWDTAASVCHASERNCFAALEFWRGGLAYYGGLIAALAFGLYFMKKERFPVGKGSDFVACGIALGLFFGRVGCFLGGCCFGAPHDGPLAVSFPRWSPASEEQWRLGLLADQSLPSLPVHPTQLYEAVGCLVIAACLYFYVEPRKRFDGQVMLVFLAAYAGLRFGLEFLRADERGALFGLATSQWISVVAVVLVAAAWRPVKAYAARVAAETLAAEPTA
jgi:phosphatidylglycerol:prolipoprotein diacylglycerol transferase